MRHRKSGRRLGRNAPHRKAMYRNMATSLLEHGRIQTTDAKAKELRKVVEKLITLSKRVTPTAIDAAEGDEARRLRATLKRGGALLGLLTNTPSEWEALRRRAVAESAEIEALVAARELARRQRDFEEADRIRDLLTERNIVLKDGPEGTTWWPGA